MIALQAGYITVVENRPMLSAEYPPSLLAKADPPCSAVLAVAELIVFLVITY